MNEMERVGSSAMKSLAAYADSDEEDNEDLSRRSGDAEDSGMEEYGAQRLDAMNRHRTLSTAEIAKAQLPEAPDCYGEDAGSNRPKRSINDEDEYEMQDRKSPLISDDFDDGNEYERLVEPPPPKRPKAFHSPSPSSSRDSTPRVGKRSGKAAFPRQPSSRALVSYSAEDEEDNNQRRSLEKADEQPIKPPISSRTLGDAHQLSSNDGSIGGEFSRPASDRSHKSSKSEGTDEIDVDDLLEKRLEAGDAAQMTGVTSPIDAVSLENIQIPPPPAEKCSEELQTKFLQYLQRKRQDGYNFNAIIQARTDFRNPSIYEKLIEHFGIDEAGTNFPKDVYDPHGFKPSDYYEEIGKAQRVMMEKLEKMMDNKDTKAKPPVAVTGGEEKKRKSKWDN